MDNLPPTIMVMAGIIAAGLVAFIGLHFSATTNHMQNVLKLLSDWIDSFRREISCFTSQVTTISLLWNTELLENGSDKLTIEQFNKFRKTNKEHYQKLFEAYSSVALHLDDRKNTHSELRRLLDVTVEKFTGNNQECGVDSQKNLGDITKKAEEVIKCERGKIEIDTPKQQRQQFIWHFFIIASIVIIVVIIMLFITSNDRLLSENTNPESTLERDIRGLGKDLEHISENILLLKRSNTIIISDIRESKLTVLNEMQDKNLKVDEHLDRHLNIIVEHIHDLKQKMPNK